MGSKEAGARGLPSPSSPRLPRSSPSSRDSQATRPLLPIHGFISAASFLNHGSTDPIQAFTATPVPHADSPGRPQPRPAPGSFPASARTDPDAPGLFGLPFHLVRLPMDVPSSSFFPLELESRGATLVGPELLSASSSPASLLSASCSPASCSPAPARPGGPRLPPFPSPSSQSRGAANDPIKLAGFTLAGLLLAGPVLVGPGSSSAAPAFRLSAFRGPPLFCQDPCSLPPPSS